jgi:hypothetical protein
MSSTTLCRTRIQQVRELAADPDVAYAARTRLHRAILACTRLVAQEVGLPKPVFPARYCVPTDASSGLQQICDITNQLLDRTKSICQPSEPLDDRWSHGWAEILSRLDELEKCLPKD